MSYQLNRKIRDLTPYQPVTGEFRIRLDANESFLTPLAPLLDEIAAAAREAMFNRYPDPAAAEVCRLFAQYHGIDPAHVTAGNGSDELLMLLTEAFLQKGEKLLTVTPDFSMYAFYGFLSENPVVELQKDDTLQISVDEVLDTIRREQVRMMIFSNPCNPTGQGLCREEVRRLITGADEYGCLIVLDEAYMDFWDQSLIKEAADYENVILLRTCSKAFGMAALRLGFAVANPRLTNALRAVKSPYNVNSLTQAVGAVMLSHPDYLRECVQMILRSRDSLYEQLCSLQLPDAVLYKPCTNFVFFKSQRTDELFEGLRQAGISVRKMGRYLRITAGTEEENREVVSVIGQMMKGETRV
ncbi:MAG: histidinol-phosphate aminotransferase family protein [Clostridiales bacterium]|nr:histidinol-phosphate aminotransferase family protein [Clostridiales bacterium]